MASQASIDSFFASVGSGRYFSRLVNAPCPHARRTKPELLYHATLGGKEPTFTVVTPVFDHSTILEGCLESVAASVSLPFDWIIIDDGSEDGTSETARSFFESGNHGLASRATIIRNRVPIYETACDNIGFTLSETEIIIEIQADIQIREPAFDRLFLQALRTSPTPSAISGRCGHTFAFLRRRRNPLRWLFGEQRDESVGLCGRSIETPERIDAIKGRTYRCETVNRGPWLLLKTDLEKHGYLDERFFFLGNDDHDYHRRLFDAEGRRPLYVPMSLYSPLHHGAIRRRRRGINREVFEMLSAERQGSPAFRQFLASPQASCVPEEIM
jgi:glycosyltransferase involved in cell wall biosynthesis